MAPDEANKTFLIVAAASAGGVAVVVDADQ